MSGFSTIPAAVDALARGEVIIVVDAEDRENEGDFICAAEKATAETINFVLGGRGQFCTPLLPEIARRLHLAPVVETNTAPLGTVELYPLPGALQGPALDATPVAGFLEGDRDFNGLVRLAAFRGAYADDGVNPGWQPALTLQP